MWIVTQKKRKELYYGKRCSASLTSECGLHFWRRTSVSVLSPLRNEKKCTGSLARSIAVLPIYDNPTTIKREKGAATHRQDTQTRKQT